MSSIGTGATAPIRTNVSQVDQKPFNLVQYSRIKLFHLRVWVIQRHTFLFYVGALLLAFVFLYRGIVKHYRHPWSNDNHQHNDLTYDTWLNSTKDSSGNSNYPE